MKVQITRLHWITNKYEDEDRISFGLSEAWGSKRRHPLLGYNLVIEATSHIFSRGGEMQMKQKVNPSLILFKKAMQRMQVPDRSGKFNCITLSNYFVLIANCKSLTISHSSISKSAIDVVIHGHCGLHTFLWFLNSHLF